MPGALDIRSRSSGCYSMGANTTLVIRGVGRGGRALQILFGRSEMRPQNMRLRQQAVLAELARTLVAPGSSAQDGECTPQQAADEWAQNPELDTVRNWTPARVACEARSRLALTDAYDYAVTVASGAVEIRLTKT